VAYDGGFSIVDLVFLVMIGWRLQGLMKNNMIDVLRMAQYIVLLVYFGADFMFLLLRLFGVQVSQIYFLISELVLLYLFIDWVVWY
jgi:hypothetical protein